MPRVEYALSVRQPWAWALATGHKDVENRDWRPAARHLGQLFAIHASKQFDESARWQVEYLAPETPVIETGAVIGVARLVQVATEYDSPWRSDSRFGFVVADARRVEPIPCLGALSFWRLPDDVRRQLHEQLQSA